MRSNVYMKYEFRRSRAQDGGMVEFILVDIWFQSTSM